VTEGTVGFVGLGNMGSVLASNLVERGHAVVVHDVLGPQRTPEDATFLPATAEVARRAEVVVLSLPDGAASERVAREVLAARDRRTTHVVDTSTIGVRAAEAVAGLLAEGGVSLVDAPVSGGVAGARARTLTVMYAGSDDACSRVLPVLEALSDRRHRVGDRPGLAQAMKLANNFLSATALAATSEAIVFGVKSGLDPAIMVDVINAGSGRNTASEDKVPRQILTRRFEQGFATGLMYKDVNLCLEEAEAAGVPMAVANGVCALWARAQAELGTDSDITTIVQLIERAAGVEVKGKAR
jgi:3-hydroxyisobutyrate dehydrogenase-like beta-hydroxyacid dehydrogenase